MTPAPPFRPPARPATALPWGQPLGAAPPLAAQRLGTALRRAWLAAGLGLLALALLWLAQAAGVPIEQLSLPAVDYLPLHTLLESATVLAAMLAFWIVWHADRSRRPAGLLVLAACMLGAALLDVAHSLSFSGMPVFVTAASRNKAAAFWLASRLLMAIGLLAAATLPAHPWVSRQARAALLAAVLGACALIVGIELWRPQWPGQLFDDGQRLLPAKIAAEALLIVLFALAGWRLQRGAAAPGAACLFAAAALGVPGEAAMTLYGASHDAFNLLGHLCKLAASYLVYRGVLQATLRQPLRQLGELAAAFEATALPVLVTDAEGCIRWANPALCRATGHRSDELVGAPAAMLEAAAGSAAHAALRRAMHEGRAWHGRLPTLRRDGSHYPDQRTVTPIRSDLDELCGHIWVGEDITERSRAEAECQRLQQQLMQAQKMEALGQLTGGIAHDFNNMLTGILGFSALARARSKDDAKLALYLGEISKVAERGRELVAKLTCFARPQAERGATLQPLLPLVQEVLQMLRPALRADIELQLLAPQRLPPVRIAAVDLHQIVTNLVLNARDAISGPGRVVLELEALAAAAGGDCSSCGRSPLGVQLALRMHDSGCGIPPAQVARIFEPFFTTKDVGRGSGLGLAMVHSMVHELGGHVRVRSSAAGSTIELLLPAGDAPAPQEPAGQEVPEERPQAVASPPPPPAGVESTWGGPASTQEPAGQQAAQPQATPPTPADRAAATVWVVDDDPVVLLYQGEMLRAQGLAVRCFADPLQALQALLGASAPPAWLITDQSMPGLSGSELARQALARWPQLAIVVCTGCGDHSAEAAALAVGVRRCIHKPFDARHLLEVLCPPASPAGATDPAVPRRPTPLAPLE